ncbi:unnamed protein product [Closterium sp. NIES-53]
MRPRFVSGDLELLSAILLRKSCPLVPFPVSSLASLLTHPGGGSTTPPHVVFYPAEPVEVAVDSGAARGVETGGAETGGAETGVA